MWSRMRRRLDRVALTLTFGMSPVAGVAAIVVGVVEVSRMWELGVPLIVFGVLLLIVAMVAGLSLRGRQ